MKTEERNVERKKKEMLTEENVQESISDKVNSITQQSERER